jgi:hypothetical protein
MPKTMPALTLLATQTRMINASEGFRLEVQSGCLWLTRPSDAVDRFLTAGSSIELHENQVLIQSDQHPGASGQETARYLLKPICAPRSDGKRMIAIRPLSKRIWRAGVIDTVLAALGVHQAFSKR